MTTCLYLGHNGELGRTFCKLYKDKLHIVGMSRSKVDHASQNLSGDLTTTDFKSLLTAYASMPAGLDHVIFGANIYAIATPDKLDVASMKTSYDVGVFTLLKLVKDLTAFKQVIKSLTVISSVSGMKPCATDQIVYGSVKAAQIHISSYAAQQLSPMRVNCVAPGRFPARVKTESVCAAVYDVMMSSGTGALRVADRD